MGRTATILMFLVTVDQFFIYMVLKDVKSENSAQRKFLAFLLLGLTLTHFLFDIMEQTKAITFRLSELNRCFFLMTSMYALLTQRDAAKGRHPPGDDLVEVARNHCAFRAQLAVLLGRCARVLPEWARLTAEYEEYYDNPKYYIYNLTNFKDTVFTLYVLLTTANYPDILVKKYGENRLVFFFFLVYTFVTIFIMVNMMVGVFYFNYKQVASASILKAETDADFAK